MSALRDLRRAPWAKYVLPATAVVAVALFPFFRPPLDGFMDDCVLALIFVAMALGLNLIVGFAGLLDLGYVAFYAFGATVVGWWASDHFTGVGGDKGVHVGVSSVRGVAARNPPELPASAHRGHDRLRHRGSHHRAAHPAAAG